MEPIAAPSVIEIPALNGGTAAPRDAGPRWVYDETSAPACAATIAQTGRQTMAFLPAGDPAARAALTERCDVIDRVFVESYRLSRADGTVELRADAPISGLGAKAMPILDIEPSVTDAELVELFATPAAMQGLAVRLQILSETPATGLCLDLTARPNLPSASVALALQTLAPDGQRCLISSVDAAVWDDPDLVDQVDVAVVQGFRAAASPADPPAPAAWFENAMLHASAQIPHDKLVVALGTRGQSWRSGTFGVVGTSFVATMATAAVADADMSYVPWANALRSRFFDTAGVLTEIWAVDAFAFHKQLQMIAPDVAIAIWPIGAEDPAIWDILQSDRPVHDILNDPVDLHAAVQIEGEGPMIISAALPIPGARTIVADPDDPSRTSIVYSVLPTPARMVRGGDADSGISVSFSDLPPKSEWPALSEILSEAGIEATFLVSSRDLVQNATVARGVVAAGHTLGLHQENHVRSSAVMSHIADNTRQLLVADRTGVQARIVEAGEPGDWTGLARNANQLIKAGYMPVVPVVDYMPDVLGTVSRQVRDNWYSHADHDDRIAIHAGPKDWDVILTNLPPLLHELQQQGYVFRSLREVAGLTRDQAMPVAKQLHVAAGVVFGTVKFTLNELGVVFLWFLIYSAVRSAIYLILSIARRPKRDFNPDWTPPVTVLIPAFNEEKVIENCIKSILESPYPNLQVVVVDDGSTDATFEVAHRSFGDNPKVKILRQANGGKWAAANHALSETNTPFFLIADADSVFTPETIAWLMQQFQDERVGAVAGIVEVGNRGSLLGNCQALEYVVSQSIIRRAQEVFEGILVVPGAVGAWRTEAVRKAGLFSGNTVTEDADLTVAVHRADYRVVFQEQARSVTEAPSTTGDFMRQRLRWTFGMLQTSWKHRAAIREGRTVGYISIIDAIWFGVLTAIFAPIVDLLLVLLVLQGGWAVFSGGTSLIASVPISMVAAYFALTVLDLLNTLVAFWFEKRFDWRLLALVPVLRFGYRQLLYISTLRAVGQALSGKVAGWNKLNRSGSVLSLWSPQKRQV